MARGGWPLDGLDDASRQLDSRPDLGRSPAPRPYPPLPSSYDNFALMASSAAQPSTLAKRSLETSPEVAPAGEDREARRKAKKQRKLDIKQKVRQSVSELPGCSWS